MNGHQEENEFYLAGIKIAEYIEHHDKKKISTAVLKALIGDFLHEHEELKDALKNIVTKHAFSQLLSISGSGNKEAQKAALIESLKRVYNQEAVNAANSFMCGILKLNSLKKLNVSPAIYYEDCKSDGKLLNDEQANLNADIEKGLSGSFLTKEIEACNEQANKKNNNQINTLTQRKGSLIVPETTIALLASFALTLIVALLARDIFPEISASIAKTEPPDHVKFGMPIRMVNDSGISDSMLANVILANARVQCESSLDQNGGYAEGIKRYHQYIANHKISSTTLNSQIFGWLSGSLKHKLIKNGSCNSINDSEAARIIKSWILY